MRSASVRVKRGLRAERRDGKSPPMTKRELDLSGLKCPLPALRTGKALRTLKPGERIAVTATDPLAGIDIPNLVRETGDVLVDTAQSAGKLTFVIEKV